MGSFVRSVMTGFAMSLGSALFKKVQGKIGLGDTKANDDAAKKAEVDEQANEDEDDPENS